MFDYTIIFNDVDKTSRAIKNNTGWNLVDKHFCGGAYKQDAVRWCKQSSRNASFELVSESTYFAR